MTRQIEGSTRTVNASQSLKPLVELPYDPSRIATSRKIGWLDRETLTNPSTMATAAGISIVVGGLMALLLASIVALFVSASGHETRMLDTILWSWGPFWAGITLNIAKKTHQDEIENQLKAARERVNSFAKSSLSHDPAANTAVLTLTNENLTIESDVNRPVMLRLDAIVLAHQETMKEIGQHGPSVARANELVQTAVMQVLEQHAREIDDAHGSGKALARLERALEDTLQTQIGQSAGSAPTAPTARISRIVETAERALSTHPDLVDGQNARVDDLVRVHVPRLLRKHAEAARTATTEEIAGVDAALDQGVDAVRASVEEAVGNLHDIAMDELVTELRFLSLRRGATPLLTSVA